MSDEHSAILRSSPALDAAIARIESEIPPKVRRFHILQKKNGARALLENPWRLGLDYVEPALMRRLQAELVHRYWRRYA